MSLKGSDTHSERVSISTHRGSVVTVPRLDVFLSVFHICAVDTNFHRHDEQPATMHLKSKIPMQHASVQHAVATAYCTKVAFNILLNNL